MSVDREKVDEALGVVSLSESAVYDTSESEYVRKAKVDEERKETRLQGLKDRLAVSDDPEADVPPRGRTVGTGDRGVDRVLAGQTFGEQAESG